MLAARVEEKDAGAEMSMRAARVSAISIRATAETAAPAATAFRHAKPNK